MKHYVSVKSKLQPLGNPRAFDFFWNAVAKCPGAGKGLGAHMQQIMCNWEVSRRLVVQNGSIREI